MQRALCREGHDYGTVRAAGPWVPREGWATANVRVDRLVTWLQIGVVTKGYGGDEGAHSSLPRTHSSLPRT